MSEQPTLHSRRSLSLRFDIPIARTHQFWDALRVGKFVTTKCKACGNVSFPPQGDCPNCMSSDHEWVDLGTDATLVTYTFVQITPASFVKNDPYMIAIGKLSSGLKVLAWLEGGKVENVKIGERMHLEARASEEGNPYYVFVRS
ncbi:MAG: Zn-ribbon domain-containing OB-fold protein [Thaumarchaeota archaeon]|nr:Zn-ribbon domain-containing OB-fold protein [Nitrososphaerota archaeon]